MTAINYESIVISNAIGLALLISLLVTSFMTRERRHLDDRIFTALILTCAGACIADPITWFVDLRPEPWAFMLNNLGNTYLYLCSAICPYLWVLYVDTRLHKGTNRIRSWHPVVGVPAAVLALLVLGNVFGHYMFTISNDNEYSRLPLSYANYILMFGQFFYSVWLKHRYERTHGKVRFFPMAMFLTPVIIGAALQAVMFGISLAWPSVCVGLASIFMSLQNEMSYIDPLTNLYNRTYLDSTLKTYERAGRQFSGIMIDLDFFKDINDKHGHSTGDEALAEAAKLLVASAPEDSSIIRYAGDEFVILISGASEEDALQTVEAINATVRDFNAKGDKPYKLSLSMGFSAFQPGSDTIDAFLSRIDEYMYIQKRSRHMTASRD